MGTSTYPISIVEGNSMYPNLQNGDLVLFHSVPNPSQIANGTIILYVQTDTGVSGLDSLIRPVVIHRVIGVVSQSDGLVNYKTKGDNNLVPDPALVPASHVLGTPSAVIPKAGLIFLFIQSPQGLVATIGFIVIFYLGKNESKIKEGASKEAFLSALAQMSLNNELPETLFKKLELAVKYSDDLKVDDLRDGQVLALVDWIKKGALEYKWKVDAFGCPKCGSKARSFESKNSLLLTICPTCYQASNH